MNGRGIVTVAGTLVLAAAALWWLRGRGGESRIEPLIPVVQQSRIPLVLHLDDAEQRAGFPADTDFLRPYTLPDRSVDDDGIPIPLPLTGSVAFPDLPVHAGARLRFAWGVEDVFDPAAAGAEVLLRVEAVPRAAEVPPVVLYTGKATAGPVGTSPARRSEEVLLPAELTGERIDLVISTRCGRTLPEAALIPAIASPVLLSGGLRARVETLRRRVPILVADLLAEYAGAVAADADWEHVVPVTTPESCFARRIDADGSVTLLPIRTSGLTPAFETDARYAAARGGPRPALFFGFEHTVVRYPIDVPEGGARLVFAIGVDHRCIGVGPADFEVTVDGDGVFAESLDPGLRPDERGWHEREVDLTPWAGERVLVGFHGTPGFRQARTVALTDAQPVGPPVSYTLEVQRVMGAFARPRVVRDAEVRRRLARTPDRPSVVIVNVETFRADAPSFAGGQPGITPALDRLAAEGTQVERCVTVAPWTSPSVASLMTGLYPASHGVVTYAQSYLADSLDVLAERARLAGVTTFAVSTNELIAPSRNFDQGFDTFLLAPYANARQVVATFEDWLADHADVQFLAYLHLFEPHHPLNAPGDDRERYVPEELKGRDPRAALERVQGRLWAGETPATEDDDVRLLKGLYLGEVRYLDRQLARLQDALLRAGLERRVVVIVTGDHGEEFLEHGLLGHGSHLYGESVLVPLVIWGPDVVPAGRVLAGPVENAQLFGMVLDLLDVDYDRSACRPAIRLDRDRLAGEAYSSTEQGIRRIEPGDPPRILTKTIHAVRGRRASFLHAPRGHDPRDPAEYELYDLEADPGETVDLTAARPALQAEMKERMRKAHAAAHARRHGIDVAELDVDTLRVMGELGYVTGSDSDAGVELFADEPPDEPPPAPDEPLGGAGRR